jgi:hypothetical protein
MYLFIGDGLSENVKVCRYFSFEAFINLIETQMLTFTKVSNWEDPWENELSRYKLKTKDGLEDPQYGADSYFFGQCWTQKIESDAMWRIYSPNLSGVKIQTKIGKLNSISNARALGVEKVVYFSHWKEMFDLLSDDKSRYQTVKYKRDSFSHEEEVRFIVHPQDILDGNDYHERSHINLPIDIAEFIEAIEIDPRAPLWIENMLKTYAGRAIPRVSVTKSALYQPNTEFQVVREYVPVDPQL